MTVNKITKAPTQNEIINSINDLIDNKQDTLIAGTDLEIVPAGLPILPEGFTQIEYIEGTGTQYIDTGYYGTQNSGVYIRFAITDQSSDGSPRVFGTRNGNSGTGAFSFISSFDATTLSNDYFYLAANGSNTGSRTLPINTEWNEVSSNVENDKKSYFNNNLLFTGNSTAFTSNAQASIFRTYNRTSYGLPATAKISVVRIYENAILVHNYIPCRRDSDNALGMYDLVSNAFLGNSGTGTFTGGPEVIYPTTTTINFTNASGYTTNEGTVTSVNNTQPDANGNVTLTIPTVNDGILTITQNGTSKGTFSANQSTNDTIALTDTTYNAFTGADGTNAGSSGLVPAPSATDNDKYLKGDGTWASVSSGSSTDVQINGTSITSGGTANIITNSAYDASSNKIATMSDLPSDEIFIATYGTTTFQEVLDAYNAKKEVVVFESIGNKVYRLVEYYTIYNAQHFHFTCIDGGPSSVAYYRQLDLIEDNTWTKYSEQILTSSSGVSWNMGAVGSSTVPAYVNSSGVATSTGLSIASSRFDGQWVSKHSTLADTVSMGNATIKTYSLASYLPDATYNYEVMFSGLVITAASSGKFLKMILDSSVVSNVWVCDARTRTSSAMEAAGSCIIPISKNSQQIVMKSEASTNSSGTMSLQAVGYRRIGTNS